MEPLSIAANVAGVATLGLQLSQTLYGLITTVHDARKEITSVANDVSLLASVLEELEGVLRRDYRVYRRQLVKVALKILNGCEGVFKDIKDHVDVSSSRHFPNKIAWYFKRERVKALQAGLESLKSTLNVLLHVVQLAKVADAAQSYQAYPATRATRDDVQREKRSLVGFLIGNKQDILHLQALEEELENESADDTVVRKVQRDDNGVYNIPVDVAGPSTSDDIPTGSGKQRSGDTSAVDYHKSSGTKEGTHLLHHPELGDEGVVSKDWNDWDTDRKEIRMEAKEEEKEEGISETVSVAPPRVHVLSSSGEYIETVPNRKEDPPNRIPTAQWFLDVVPHAQNVTALVRRSFHNETTSARTRAEETAKTLLLTWTGMDLDGISEEEDSGTWNSADNRRPDAPPLDAHSQTYWHAAPSMPSQYPQPQSYAPPPWPPQHQFYDHHQPYLAPAPSYPYPSYPSPVPAYQEGPDMFHSNLRRRTPQAHHRQHRPPIPPEFPPFAPEPDSPIPSEFTDEDMVNEMVNIGGDRNSAKTANDELQGADQHSEPLMNEKQSETEPQTATIEEEVVILQDALGRSIKIPFRLCKTLEGLDKAIKEALSHVEEYGPLAAAGYYDIVTPDGEIILKSCWESMVQPGWKVNMVMWPMSEEGMAKVRGETETSDSTSVTNKSDIVTAPLPAAPVAPDTRSLHEQTVSQSRDDAPSAVDGDDHGNEDDDVDNGQIERALWEGNLQHLQDRYVRNENLLTKQKRAKASVQIKLERNRRFVQLRQQLADQEAILRSRQEAADEAEQDAHLSWLEKQVANQRAELDALSPPLSAALLTPPPSAKSTSSGKSDAGSKRKSSVRARLFGRGSFRSIRSRDSGESAQLNGLDETNSGSLTRLRLMDE